jgi:uncharacterized protein
MSLDRTDSTNRFKLIRRPVLGILTILVLFNLIFSVLATRSQAQVQDKFQLYQTNLVLTAAEWQPDSQDDRLKQLKSSLFGSNVIGSAIEQYQTSEQGNIQTIAKIDAKLASDKLADGDRQKLEKNKVLAQAATSKLDLNLGILTAVKGDVDGAIEIWNRAVKNPASSQIEATGKTLIKVWKTPDSVDRQDLDLLTAHLNGWFRDRSLMQVYTAKSDNFSKTQLDVKLQDASANAIGKLFVLSIGRIILGLVGLGLLLFALIKSILKLLRRQAGESMMMAISPPLAIPWNTPWNWEIVWQVLLVGFFLVGQFIVPILFSTVFKVTTSNIRIQALYILSSYAVMSGLGIAITYFSIKPYLPLPDSWFKFTGKSNWFIWGVSGYLVAIPIVTIVSLLNDRIWQGQGGSNPILEIVLEGHDRIAVIIFFLTAAVAAPLFEEFFFRGFLLPSLTKYIPVWAAIVVSALVFGIAHLSLSEIIPLTILGMILGVVYARTRNLLASMLLHSLWNAGTLVSLFILGSGNAG